ncbi:MAG: hypothetical protein GY711_21170 [bacterium]|nr:hypothetical protein [bacterium]
MRYCNALAALATLLAFTSSAQAQSWFVAPGQDVTLQDPWRMAVGAFEEFDMEGAVDTLGALSIDTLDTTVHDGLGERVRLFTSGSFAFPGRMCHQALHSRSYANGYTGRVVFEFDPPVAGIGMWVFDDSGSGNQGYRLRITDDTGSLPASPMLAGITTGLEGFIGVYHPPGIVAVSIESLDAATEIPVQTSFFLDHVQITGSGPPATHFCDPANDNSSSGPAWMAASGSSSVVDNQVTLSVSGMPAGQFGYFLVGVNAGIFMPPGAQGPICLANNIGRYNDPPEILMGPTASLTIDLTQLPTNPATTVVAGDQWRFQCWYRDVNLDPTSNFSDAIAIRFR